jgi:hypothetical protein
VRRLTADATRQTSDVVAVIPLSGVMTSLKAVVEDFSSSTTAHGLQQVCIPPHSGSCFAKFLRQAIWVSVWLAAASYMSYEIYRIIDQFARYDSTTRFSVEQKERVPFPAVTICNMNPLRNSSVVKWLEKCDDLEKGELRNICDSNAIFMVQALNQGDEVRMQKLGRALNFELMRENFEDVARNLSHNLEDIFVKPARGVRRGVSNREGDGRPPAGRRRVGQGGPG